jgi:hypothetical protein
MPARRLVTVSYQFYNNHGALRAHVAEWKKLDPELLEKAGFQIVDDGSQRPAEVDLPDDFPLEIYRMDKDNPWNQSGARNLNFTMATTPWIFASDMDHLMGASQVSNLVAAITHVAKEDTMYTVHRKLADDTLIEPHCNSYLVARKAFFDVGGIDEDFSGGYGFEDVFFLREWVRAGLKIAELDSVTLTVLNDISDSMTINLSRDQGRNRKIFDQKLSGALPRNPRLLNFSWTRLR